MDDEAAIEQLIEKEPGNLSAIIRKADLRLAAGDDKTANAFYLHALQSANGKQVSPELMRDLQRAQHTVQQLSQRFVDYLEDRITSAGFGPANRPPRFQEALDILLGRRQAVIELQKPRTLHYPGLPQRRYYEADEFDWSSELEAQTETIREELTGLLHGDQPFQPYLYSDPSQPPKHGPVDNLEWSSFNLWQEGKPVQQNIARCPRTMAAVEKTDLLTLPERAPHVMFSKLVGGGHIKPHVGLLNCRLVCHLPIIVPDGCVFRVAGEDRRWEEGKLLTFDDSVVHEAMNNGTEDRVVLIFEIWRPELTQDERGALTALFSAVDHY